VPSSTGSTRGSGSLRQPEDPPLRLVLGADAIGNIERRWQALAEELDGWRSVGEATVLDDV
jgi:hypothetical protein